MRGQAIVQSVQPIKSRCARTKIPMRAAFMVPAVLSALTATALVSTTTQADGPRDRSVHADGTSHTETQQSAKQHTQDANKNGRLTPIRKMLDGMMSVRSIVQPIGSGNGAANGAAAGICDPVAFTYSSTNFEQGSQGEVIIQAGFVEDEIAAVSFELDPSEFPIILNKTEMIFGQEATVETTTQWSWLVWEGTPTNGSLIAEESSSDGTFLQPIVLQPAPPGSAVGVNVVVEIDPNDPDQIVINDNGTHKFTVGYRIDEHNVPGDPCLSPPPANSNLFPTTDADGVATQSNNWLFAVDGFLCICSPGMWSTFGQLISQCTPSGDWSIRATYTPATCEDPPGACCFSDGGCESLTESECVNAGGTFEGEGVTCASADCAQPTGACCFEGDTCATLIEEKCEIAGGEFWAGPGTDCASFDCDPVGACCLSDGTCVDGVDPTECKNAGGTFQGDDVSCADVVCPEPMGACCLANGACFSDLTESNCLGIPDAAWAGPGTTCADDNNNGQADICEAGDCPADLDGSGTVDVGDLLALLGAWGNCGDPCPPTCLGDIDGNCAVDVGDLLELLGAWGPCE